MSLSHRSPIGPCKISSYTSPKELFVSIKFYKKTRVQRGGFYNDILIYYDIFHKRQRLRLWSNTCLLKKRKDNTRFMPWNYANYYLLLNLHKDHHTRFWTLTRVRFKISSEDTNANRQQLMENKDTHRKLNNYACASVLAASTVSAIFGYGECV